MHKSVPFIISSLPSPKENNIAFRVRRFVSVSSLTSTQSTYFVEIMFAMSIPSGLSLRYPIPQHVD
ncbi:hypothetical protein CIW52_04145 [Mycolicibacterium sp. P9-64]|nr:hypothetical protein CIW52_04145 [Mycolicibacterium sp. P9-64]